jgi:hypothetical protein
MDEGRMQSIISWWDARNDEICGAGALAGWRLSAEGGGAACAAYFRSSNFCEISLDTVGGNGIIY